MYIIIIRVKRTAQTTYENRRFYTVVLIPIAAAGNPTAVVPAPKPEREYVIGSHCATRTRDDAFFTAHRI